MNTITFDREWYDAAMTERGAPSMLPLEDSPWLGLYEHVVSLIEPHEPVVDLGCGTGRFLEALKRNEHYAETRGVDWSAASLDEARAYVRARGSDVDFALVDLSEWEAEPARAGGTVYVCLETLEHLAFDLDLVDRIPPGHRFIFSVPNYDSESHERRFYGLGDVFERFGVLVEFTSWKLISIDDRKAIHVLETRRRKDAW